MRRTRAGWKRGWGLETLVVVGEFLGELRLRRDLWEAWAPIPGVEEYLPACAQAMD